MKCDEMRSNAMKMSTWHASYFVTRNHISLISSHFILVSRVSNGFLSFRRISLYFILFHLVSSYFIFFTARYRILHALSLYIVFSHVFSILSYSLTFHRISAYVHEFCCIFQHFIVFSRFALSFIVAHGTASNTAHLIVFDRTLLYFIAFYRSVLYVIACHRVSLYFRIFHRISFDSIAFITFQHRFV